MEENEEYDSDSTVLLTDFANKPQKIDVKRRRLSHLQDRSQQSGQFIENNVTPHDVSENIQASSTLRKNGNWRITNYFSRINEMNNTNLRNNISDLRRNEIEPKLAPDCQSNPGNILKGNTARTGNEDNIICLDSDEDMENNEATQNADQNSLVIRGINISKLIVLKPAAINARRATANCVYDKNTQNIATNDHINSSKLIVLKPAAINARRASINCVSLRQEGIKRVLYLPIINGRTTTTHFVENNLESSLTNENNVLNKGIEESGKDEQAEKDYDTMKTPRSSNLQRTVANSISNTRAGSSDITEVCVETQAVNSLSSIWPVSSNPSNTIICHKTTSKNLRQDAVSNTVSNVNAHKRFGNIESQIEPKRIKKNMKQTLLVLPSTVVYKNGEENNGNPKESKGEERYVERDEHTFVSDIIHAEGSERNVNKNIVGSPLAASARLELTYVHPQSMPPTPARRSTTLESNSTNEEEVLDSETFNKECTDKDTNIEHVAHQGSLSSVKPTTSKVQAQEVRSEGYENHIMTVIIDEPMTNNKLETRHATDCRVQEASDQNDTSEILENQDANKGQDNPKTSDLRENSQDNAINDVQDQQKVNKTFDQLETRTNHNKTVTNEEIINGVENTGDDVKKAIENETNKKQDASKVFNVRDPSETDVDQVTTNQEQETIQIQRELNTRNNNEKQISNTARDYHETGKLQDKHISSETLDTEDLSTEQYKDLTSIAPKQETQKVSSEQITYETKSCNKQETGQQNVAITGVVDSECMFKFQRWFFTIIIENLTEMQKNITETNPESSIMLKNIIKTLVDTRNRTDQTNVEYSCPKCGCVSNYSSGLLDNTGYDGSNHTADNLQDCRFCCYIRKLHTTYFKRYLNKKYRNVNNKEAVRNTFGEKAHPSLEIAGSHSNTIPKNNTSNDLVSNSEARGSLSNLTVENEKKIDNFTLTQSCSNTKTENHNVSKDYKIVNEAPCLHTSQRDILSSSGENNSEINVVSNETNSKSVTLKELSDQDTSITQNNETTADIKLTGSHVNEVVSILDKLTIKNKRTNSDEHAVSHKRMKTAAENNISYNDQNLKTKDNYLYSTTVVQSEFSVIENNKNYYQPTHGNCNSADELPNNIGKGEQSVTPESSKNSHLISPVVVGTVGTHNNGECNNTESSDLTESLSETHTNTTNIPETDKLKFKSHNTSNEVTNDKIIKLCSQKAGSVEVEENDNSIKNASDKSGKETITESNVSKIDSQVINTEEINKNYESLLTSLEDCFTQLKHSSKEGEGNQVKGQVKKLPLQKFVSKQNVSCDKFRTRTAYNNLVVKYKYICPNCTSMYTHASKLLQHMKLKHNLELVEVPEKSIKLQCPFCKNLFLENYNKHVMRCSELEHNYVNKTENKIHSSNENKGNICEENITSHKTSEITKFKYHCVVCDKSLSTDYAARQHRQQIHPEFKHRRIIKKTRIGDKVDKQNINAALDTEEDDDEDPSTDEFCEFNTSREGDDSASDCISLTDISSQNTTNSERSWNPSSNQDASCNEDEDDCDSDDCSFYSYKLHETSDAENNERCDKSKTLTMNASKEGASTDSKGSHGTKNRKKYVFKCLICNTILYSDYASRKHRANQHPKMRGVPIFNKIKKGEPGSNERKSIRLNIENNDKVSERCKKNIIENTSDSDWSTVSNLDCTAASSTRNAHNSGQWAVNSDIGASSEDSSLGSCSEEETASKDEHNTKTVSKRSNRKRRKRAVTIKKYTRIEDNSDSDWIISADESADSFNEMKDSDIFDGKNIHTDGSNDGRYLSIDDVALAGSADETIKSSPFTVKKRKERLSKLFGDENDSQVDDSDQRVISKENVNKSSKIRNHSDNQYDSNQRNPSSCANDVLSDDEIIKVSEHTIKKRKERRLMFDDGIQQERNGALIQSSNHVSTGKNSGNKYEISKNNEAPYEKPSELKEGEYNPVHREEGPNQQVQNKETTSEDCDIDPATDHNSSTNSSDKNNTMNYLCDAAYNTNAITLNHNDRVEIDLIDGLLEEYNSQTLDNQQSNSCVEKENNAKDDREPNMSDAQSSEANDESQVSLPSDKITNCFENIQITNVRSIANKLLIFMCQECSFATHTYDDVIRHCHNHLNHVEDPVSYCNICQVNYDTSCFNRHQIWHDKCLISYKIKFSFRWLFSNWHAIFDNKNLSLREAEEIQIKSIYKTHCIKMTVKEAGPWQSALYLCAKCNTCVPPRDIEKHVQNNCTSENYPCTLCNHAFLTLEMREHHEIYHEGGITQQFKTIVFNEETDESFNSKLIQAKLHVVKNKQNQLNVDIYKCLCGLCFITMKKFKLHFVDCDTQTNNGVKCSRCPGERRFLCTDLEDHFSLHHSVIKYAFRVQQITFQQEYDYNSLELESVSMSTENTTDNAIQIRSNDVDINIKKDMLKADSLLHDNINIIEEDLEIISTAKNSVRPISTDELLNIERHILKDEPLTQHTSGENMQENVDIIEGDLNKTSTTQMSIDKVLTIKINLLKDQPLSQITSGEYSQEDVNVVVVDTKNKSTTETVSQVTRNVKDLNTEKDILKHQLFSRNSYEENLQYEGTAVNAIDKDIDIKKYMLKDESLSQGTIEGNMQEEVDIFEENLKTSTVERVAVIDTNEDLNIENEMLKDESLSQNSVEERTQENLDTFKRNLETSTIERVAVIDTNEDLKKDMSKNESLSQNSVEERTQENLDTFERNLETSTLERVAVIDTNEDLKKDMSKDESLSQNSVEERTQENLDTFKGNLETSTVESVALIAINEDINIKREMLKNELLSQNSVTECIQENLDNNDENLINNGIAENTTKNMPIDEDLNDIIDTTKSILQENIKGKKPESPSAAEQHLKVERASRNVDSDPIVIDDSDDDDVELIEDPNEFKFARRRACADINKRELLLYKL